MRHRCWAVANPRRGADWEAEGFYAPPAHRRRLPDSFRHSPQTPIQEGLGDTIRSRQRDPVTSRVHSQRWQVYHSLAQRCCYRQVSYVELLERVKALRRSTFPKLGPSHPTAWFRIVERLVQGSGVIIPNRDH